jgi:ParB family transcriptional regulator, chromosome partitioning protein
VNRKDTLRSFLSAQPELEPSPDDADSSAAPEQEHTGSGAVKAMGDTLRKLTADAEIGRVLKDQLTDGGRVLELEPRTIERSFISDRLSDSDDPDFHALIESVKANGQLVPILVRPHPEREGHFQVAYGHRRLRAAELLQIKVKAAVRYLSDVEMVVAQGKENSERRDLSFIERALFAIHLEERRFERNVIMAALCIDKAEAAKLLGVARAVPAQVILAIGPAPRIGRPRWVALAKLIGQPGNERNSREYSLPIHSNPSPATEDSRLYLPHYRIRRKAWFRTNTGLTQPDGGSSRFKGGRRGRLSSLTRAWSPPLESTSRRTSAIFTPSLRAGEGSESD